MRGAGAKGGPAMGGGASRVVFAIDGMGLGDQVALLTDGHLSGLVCKGLVLAEISPEAALGGPLALLRDGNRITIDLDTRRCDVDFPDTELAARRAAWVAPAPNFDRAWLQIYRRNVGPLGQGRCWCNTMRRHTRPHGSPDPLSRNRHFATDKLSLVSWNAAGADSHAPSRI